MTKCWKLDPKERPTFEDILKLLQDMLMGNKASILSSLSRNR